MNTNQSFIDYTLFLADSCLVLSQKNAEWCAHGPILEQDIAITNITLDLVGQARNFYQLAAAMINQAGNGPATEDSLAYLRTEREYKNLLITELPNDDWAHTVLRQFFFSVYQYRLLEKLMLSDHEEIAAIAAKSIKETTYHVKWSSEWVIRLGDGTAESHERMEKAITDLWAYTGEFFMPASYENAAITGVDIASLEQDWLPKVKEVFEEATLTVPEKTFMQSGGKTGTHTEHMGYLLADMQYLQRTYPGAEW